LVIEALRRVPELNWRLTVVGSGSSVSDWKELVLKNSLGERVTFTGLVPRERIEDYYLEADAFVFPALRDSGGSGLLEAMSYALPVVCCDWGGPAEIVDGNSGIKVSVASPEAAIEGFVAAFKRLQADPAWRLATGQNAFRRAGEIFSWSHKRAVLEATYEGCLGARR